MNSITNGRSANKLTVFSNVTDQESDKKITFDELVKMVESPVDLSRTDWKNLSVAKLSQSALSASGSNRKTKEAVTECNSMTCLWGDLDAGGWRLKPLAQAVAALGLESFVIHSTVSYTKSEPRWRVIIELAAPIDLELWKACQSWLAAELGGDVCATKPTQLFFLPAKGPGGYFYHIGRGVALDVNAR